MSHKYSTLSAAIRAGSKLAPQAFGTYTQDGGTCAIGAVMAATGKFAYELCELFPYFVAQNVDCPANCGQKGSYLSQVMVHLNDIHYWTREAIADFVESWENEHLGYETITEEVTEDVSQPAVLLQQEAALQR